MSGLFSTFNVAKRGMGVQQKALDVTSHNIANSNTPGYSRQRALISTTRPFGMPSINSVAEPGQLGTGAQIESINRIRDSFLDYQFRAENSTYGWYGVRENFLGEIEAIFNEPSDTGISSLIGKFFDAWQEVSKHPQSTNARTVLAQQTLSLTNALNQSATQLEKLKENSQELIKNSVFEINDVLRQVDQLNSEIMAVKISGNIPNDLMDKRDLLLDELSEKFNITVDKKAYEGVDIKPEDMNGLNGYLVKAIQNGDDRSDIRRISYIDSLQKNPDGSVTLTYYKLGNKESDANKEVLTLNGLTDDEIQKLDETRILWANEDGIAVDDQGNELLGKATFDDLALFTPSSGSIKGLISVQKDVNENIAQLDRVAKAIAFAVNAVHSGKEELDAGGNPDLIFFVNKDSAKYTDGKLSGYGSDAENSITAKNITINKTLADDVMKINAGAKDPGLSGEGDGTRALEIAGLRNVLINIQYINGKDPRTSITTRKDLFDPLKGGNTWKDGNLGINNGNGGTKIDNYFKDTINRLGVQSKEAQKMVKNQETLLSSFDERRLSVSGVSIDEEIANLIQFQHSYSANAKIVSTVDELLDVIVNGLKK